MPSTDRTISRLFEHRAQSTPEAIAVLGDDTSLSYEELNKAANALARTLCRAGLSTGEYVPIIMPRCIELIVSQLAILKCGGAYVPIDPEFPKQRQEFILRDCRAQRVLALRTVPPLAPAEQVHWVDEILLTRQPDVPAPNLDIDVLADSPACVMYTSGSTGIPKGVIVPHRGIRRLVIDNGYIEIEETERIAHCSNPSFDAATFEIWGALLNGAAIVIVPQSVLLSMGRFSELLRARVTTLFLTTALFNQYALIAPETFSHLRHLLFGGEPPDPRCVARVLDHDPPKHLLNMYGPTEATTFATFYAIHSVPDGATTIPAGNPIAATQIYVLDDHYQPVPPATFGEVYIGGAGLALGYLNRPDLTAQVFVPDLVTGAPSSILYDTGDIGRWNAGVLELKGRKDSQVKLRGFRIELGEVETALRSHPKVQQAIAVVREDHRGDKRLVGYVVPVPAAHCNDAADGRGARPPAPQAAEQLTSQLRAHLRETLPHYMAPSSIVLLDCLPLTPNGKIDRKALPAPPDTETQAPYAPPETPLERAIVEAWSKVLGCEGMGIDDNFLELGGNSIHAVAVSAALESVLGADTPVLSMYRHPTARALAASLQSLSMKATNQAEGY